MQATLNSCLAEVYARLGRFEDALSYDRQSLLFEARSQSLWAREHAISVHHTLDSLRGETEEFITHDLRNPLGAALVQIESIARHSDLNPAQRALLSMAQQKVQHAMDAADFHLTIVRVRNLRRAGLSNVDPAELLDDVAERRAPPAGAASRLERDIEWGLSIRGDRISLLSAMDCLLRLALAQCSQGEVVHCRLYRRLDYAVLAIELPQSTWTEELRFQFVTPPRVSHSHMIMAAAMVAKVAQLHDSRIEVEQVPGNDARVCVNWCLPLVGTS